MRDQTGVRLLLLLAKLVHSRRGLIALATLLCAGIASAQTAPNLGLALPQFGVLGGSRVTGSTGLGTSINGDVGSSPTPTITNFPPSRTIPPFIVHDSNDAVVQQAHADAIAAYNNLFTQGTAGGATPLGPQLNGRVLGPGVYRFAAEADLAAGGTLTLSGAGVYIFSIGTALTANVNSTVLLLGGANACNVYWQVGSSATLDGNDFVGTVIADQSVTVASSNDLLGRAVAINGAVTMPGAGGNIIGGCSSPAGGPPPAPPPPPSAVSCPAGMVINGPAGTATVTLPAPAPVGGTVVTLSSSAPNTATVPQFVVVSAGASSATFTVNAGTVAGSATITATTAGGSASCTVIIGAAIPPSGGSTLDAFGLAVLLVLLAAAGVFAVNRFMT